MAKKRKIVATFSNGMTTEIVRSKRGDIEFASLTVFDLSGLPRNDAGELFPPGTTTGTRWASFHARHDLAVSQIEKNRRGSPSWPKAPPIIYEGWTDKIEEFE